jgi:hypothetical protein
MQQVPPSVHARPVGHEPVPQVPPQPSFAPHAAWAQLGVHPASCCEAELSGAESKPVSSAEPESDPAAASEPVSDAEAESSPASASSPKPDPESDATLVSELESEPVSDARVASEPDSEAEAARESAPESEPASSLPPESPSSPSPPTRTELVPLHATATSARATARGRRRTGRFMGAAWFARCAGKKSPRAAHTYTIRARRCPLGRRPCRARVRADSERKLRLKRADGERPHPHRGRCAADTLTESPWRRLNHPSCPTAPGRPCASDA